MITDNEQAEEIMTKFKLELEGMRKMAKPDDVMPAEVFFTFMDVLIPVFDGVIDTNKKLKEQLDGSK